MLVGLAAAGLGFAFVANSKEVDPFAPASENPADEAPPVPTQVQVQVEYVEMSHEALTKLLFLAKPTTADATALRQHVQDMVSKNEAKVLETQIVVARSGQKARSESIHEFIYPTEYEEPELPCNTSKSTVIWHSGPVPTAFETRNLGSNLEIEPTAGDDDRTIDLRFTPELVWHTGNITWHEGKDAMGNTFHVQMPDMYTLRLSTALTCISGQYTFAGIVSPKTTRAIPT